MMDDLEVWLEYNTYDVESHRFHRDLRTMDILAGGPPKHPAFVLIHSLFRIPIVACLSRLYFDEHKLLALPTDKVGFAPLVASPPVARHHAIPFALKIPVREVLASHTLNQSVWQPRS
jgi:hypothetical protein